MSSERQVEANRQNAQRSTGPHTAGGKARVALNALKHGLTGKQVVLPNEDPEDFDAFRDGLLSALEPHDEFEGTLAERIVIDAWRLRRATLLESGSYRRGLQELIIEDQEDRIRGYEYRGMIGRELDNPKLANSDRRAHADALTKLTELRSKLDDSSVKMTMVFERYSETFANLSRYEAGLNRSFLRNLHELQRLQAMKAGERVAAPAVVDVDISLSHDGAANPEAIIQNELTKSQKARLLQLGFSDDDIAKMKPGEGHRILGPV
jgi:hypothetical protein